MLLAQRLRADCGYDAVQVARVLRHYLWADARTEVPDALKAAGFTARPIADALRSLGVDPRDAVEILRARMAFEQADVVPAVVGGYDLPPAEQPAVLAAKARDGNRVVYRGYPPERFSVDLVRLQPGVGFDQLRALTAAFVRSNEAASGPRLIDAFSPDVVLQSVVNAAAATGAQSGSAAAPASTRRTTNRKRRSRRAVRRARAAQAVERVLVEGVRAMKAEGHTAAYVLDALRVGYRGDEQIIAGEGGIPVALPLVVPDGARQPDGGGPTVLSQHVEGAARIVREAGYGRGEIALGLAATYLAEVTPVTRRYLDVARLFRDVFKDRPCDTARLLAESFGRSPAQVAGALQSLRDGAGEAMAALKCAFADLRAGDAAAALTAGLGEGATRRDQGLATYPLTSLPAALATVYSHRTSQAVYGDLRAAGFLTPEQTAGALLLTTDAPGGESCGGSRASRRPTGLGRDRAVAARARAAAATCSSRSAWRRFGELATTYAKGWKGVQKPVADETPAAFADALARAFAKVESAGSAADRTAVKAALGRFGLDPDADSVARALHARVKLDHAVTAVRGAFGLNPHRTFMTFEPLVDSAAEQVRLVFELTGIPNQAGRRLLEEPVGTKFIEVLLGEPTFSKAKAIRLVKLGFEVSEIKATRAYERTRQRRPDVLAKDIVDAYLEAFPDTSLARLASELRGDYKADDVLGALLPYLRPRLGIPERPVVGDNRLFVAAVGILTRGGYDPDQTFRTVKKELPAYVPERAGEALRALLKPAGVPGDLIPGKLLDGGKAQLEGLDALGYSKCAGADAVARGAGTSPDVTPVIANWEAVHGSLTSGGGQGLRTLGQCFSQGGISLKVPLRAVTVEVPKVELGRNTIQIDYGVLVGHVGLSWQGLDIARGLPGNLAKVPLFGTDDMIEQAPSTPKSVNPHSLRGFGGLSVPKPLTIVVPNVPLGGSFAAPKLTVEVTYYSRPGGWCVAPTSTDAAYHAAAILLSKGQYEALPGKERFTGTQKWKPSYDVAAFTGSPAEIDVLKMGSGSKSSETSSPVTSMSSRDNCGSIRSGTWKFTTKVTSRAVTSRSGLPSDFWRRSRKNADAARLTDVWGSVDLASQLNRVHGDVLTWLATQGWTGTPTDVSRLATLL